MIQSHDRPRLPLESLRESFRGNLHCDIAPDASITGTVHLAHAALANERKNLVMCSPPGYLILVNSGGPFFNELPMFQSIGISKDYTQQIDAIRGGTERAQVFLLLHELGHLFGITRNDNGTTDDKTNQAWNNDDCG
jgi:hypothetical protein